MEKSKRIGLFCLVFFFVVVVLLSSLSALEEYDQRVYKISSTYSYQTCCPKTSQTASSQKTHYYSYDNDYNYKKVIWKNTWYRKETNRISPPSSSKAYYTHYGYEDTRKSFWGDYVKEYSVYVTNRGGLGRYFTVKFSFEDKNGYKFSQSITQYLREGEKKEFVYRDIQYERNEILNWDYKIIPRDY